MLMIRALPFCLLCLVLGVLAPVGSSAASDFPVSRYLTGNWNGLRDDWQQAGVELFFNATAEPMRNISGGERIGGTWPSNLGLELHLDLAKLLGVANTGLLVKVSKRDGNSVSIEDVAPSQGGNLFPVQELYGGQTLKLANVQFNTRLFDDQLDLAYGRLVANDDFLRSPLYCQFLNNAICGSPKAVFFENPFAFSAYPSAQWGLRARLGAEQSRWTLQLGLYDADIDLKGGDPTAPARNRHGTDWSFGDNGVVLAGELQYRHDSATGLDGRYKLGGFWMNGDYQDLSSTDPAATVRGNAMLWLTADQTLWRPTAASESASERGISGFATWILSLEDKVNLMSQQFSLGLVWQGPFASRAQDALGLAVSRGWVSTEQNKARRAQGLATAHTETALELNYRIALGRGLALTPDIQYILDPGATGDIDNAWLVGAKISLDF